MPIVKIFVTDSKIEQQLLKLCLELRQCVAELLSCNDRKLSAEEISVRIVPCVNVGMIANVEVEITAHAYPARIKEQDVACRKVADWLEAQLPEVSKPHVWLLLCELGHSWEESS